VTPEPATVSNLSRSLTKRLDNLKAQYQRDLVPLTQEREALSREIMELRAARDVYLEETTVLNARNEELAQLSAQYARRMASGPEPTKPQDARNRERVVAGEKDTPKPPAILQQPLPQHTAITHATPTSQNTHVPSQPSQGLVNRPPMQSQYLQPAVTTYGQEEVADPRYGKVQAIVEGTPSKTPRFGMKWPVSKAKDMTTQASFSDLKAKTTMEHNFQPLSLLRFTRCDHCGDKMWGSQLRCTGRVLPSFCIFAVLDLYTSRMQYIGPHTLCQPCSNLLFSAIHFNTRRGAVNACVISMPSCGLLLLISCSAIYVWS
jgi:Rho-type GTPase-activating protein 1/2